MEKDSENARLYRDLVKLGDMIGDGLHYEDASISRAYRKTAKALFPEMYPRKQRKPTQNIIRTLKPCDCGESGWKFIRYADGVQISCKQCARHSEKVQTNSLARDSWNKTFDGTY